MMVIGKHEALAPARALQHEAQFEALLAALRQSEEWLYVDREIDIRLELV